MEILKNHIYVYTKNKELLFVFDGENDGESEVSRTNVMVSPIVRMEQNGESTFKFQMLTKTWAWQQIKNPENLYLVNGRWYSPLNENSYIYSGVGSTRVVDVTCVEIWYLLRNQFNQAYNCGLYTYAKATFQKYVTNGAVFKIKSSDCSIPGESISKENAWEQVKLWRPKDDNGNKNIYSILKSKENEAKGWKDIPSNVTISDILISGDTVTITVTSSFVGDAQEHFEYSSNNLYTLNSKPFPASLKRVYLNSTIYETKNTQVTINNKTETKERTTVNTSDKDVKYSYNSSTGKFSITYNKKNTETINYIVAIYEYCHLGDIENGATCTFAWGAEVVDEHTFLILPKADKRYKLTIDGIKYNDNQVKDSRGVVMPRGSGGYAMWAALKNSGWGLGICDVIATGFDPTIDYGVFNVESDQKDVLYNIQYIQQLYGGILDWDSNSKVLNYRAENDIDYQSYKDGFNDWTGYEFREGKNMNDQPNVTYDNNIITRAYLIGYGGLNVKKVNGGKSYIENFSYTKDVYEGYLTQELIYDTRDEGGQKQLLYWGEKELAKLCKPRKKIRINGFDIRTVERNGVSYEHEVFNLNDVVRVWSKEEDSEEETYEEKRITLWEYNVFAVWDSTVELGDKTQNLSEVFKLVYNKTIDAPGANGSGDISSGNIDMTPGNEDSGDSLADYIAFIASTTTANTEALAGLQLITNSLSSTVNLFASYEEQLDNMINQTYAGLQFYADREGSRVEMIANGYYKELDGELGALEKTVTSGFQAEQNKWNAWTNTFSQYQTTVNGQMQNNLASMKTYTDDKVAHITLDVQDTYGQTTLTMRSDGIYIDSASFSTEPSDYEQIRQTIKSWSTGYGFEWGGPTFINGNMIATDTLLVSTLNGGQINLIDDRGSLAGWFELNPATSWGGMKVDFVSGAIAITAQNGTLSLSSGGNSNILIEQSGIRFYANSISGLGNNGRASEQWNDIYSRNALITTSDKTAKKDISYDLSPYDSIFDSLKPCTYKFEDGNRTHSGLIAQDIEQSLTTSSISDKDFAAFIKSPKEDNAKEFDYGIRYGELIPLCIDQIQRLKKEVETLKSQLSELSLELENYRNGY